VTHLSQGGTTTVTWTQKPTNLAQWRAFVTGNTDICEQYEIRLTELIGPDEATPITLRFMSPYQSDDDLMMILRRIAQVLPWDYRDHLVDVQRTTVTEGTPPYIDVTLAQPVAFDNTVSKVWTDWAANCSVLREFDLRVDKVDTDATGRQVNIVLTRDGRLDVEDLRAQLSRIRARLAGTSYEGCRALIYAPEGPVNTATLALRLDRDEDLWDTPRPLTETPDEPADPEPGPQRRWGWQTVLDRALVALHRKVRGADTEIPDGYPERVHRQAALFGLALGAAGAVTVLAMAVVGLLGAIATSLGQALGNLATGDAASVVLGPVRSYTEAFLDGPPFGGHSMFALWATIGGLCFLLGAAARNIGARIGWCLWGAATAWMVWRGSSIGVQQHALAITACWWILGSLFVFRRDHRPRQVVAHVPGMDVDDQGRLTSRQHLSHLARQAVRSLRQLGPGMPVQPIPPAQRHPRTERPPYAERHPHLRVQAGPNGFAVTATEANEWEQLLEDAGEPGMVLLSGPTPTVGESGFRLHMALPTVQPGEPGSKVRSHVRTIHHVRNAVNGIEVLLGQRFAQMFETGTVAPGSVTVENAKTSDGAEIAGEVVISVFTGRVLNPAAENIRPAIVEIVRAAGLDGITPADLYAALLARGFRSLGRAQLTNILMGMRIRPADGMPRVVSAGGVVTVEPDMRD
jgi:hypothetical protein